MTNVKESVHDRIERQRQEEIDRNMMSLNKLSDGVFILTAPFALAYKLIKRPFSKKRRSVSQNEKTTYGDLGDIASSAVAGTGKLIKFGLDSVYEYKEEKRKNSKEYIEEQATKKEFQEQIPLEEVEQYVFDNFEDGYGPGYLSKAARLSYAREKIYEEHFQK